MSGSIGTIKTPAALYTEEPDNTSGAISPQILRNLAESAFAMPIYGTTETTSFSVNLLDMRGTMILVNSATLVTATLVSNATTGHPIGTLINFRPIGAGMISFAAGSGATITPTSGTTRATGSWVSAHKTGTNTWFIDGDLA